MHGGTGRGGRPGAARGAPAIILAAALAAALLAMSPAGAEERLAGPVAAEVLAVVDGDTLEVRAHIWLGQGLRVRVRLAGIDAPELRGRCGRERALADRARAFLQARLEPAAGAFGQVRLRNIRYGKYAGRVVAEVETAAGTDLGRALLAAGLARAYAGRTRAPWCLRAADRPAG